MKNGYRNLKTRFLTFPEQTQVLHLVSDLNKAMNVLDLYPSTSKNHLYRAMILLDYMLEDPKWKAKMGELLRLREAVGSFLFHEKSYANMEQLLIAALHLEPKAYRTYYDC